MKTAQDRIIHQYTFAIMILLIGIITSLIELKFLAIKNPPLSTIILGLSILLSGFYAGKVANTLHCLILSILCGTFIGFLFIQTAPRVPQNINLLLGGIFGSLSFLISSLVGKVSRWIAAKYISNKNRGNSKFILISFILVTTTFTANALEFEKGDGMFRRIGFIEFPYPIPFVSWLGHTGLYRDFQGTPPVNSWEQRIIEMQFSGVSTSHTLDTWELTVGTNDIWGVKTINSLTSIQRQELSDITENFSLIGTQYDAFTGYKNPLGSPPTFRCDGLVEYAYEEVLGEEWRPANTPPFTNGGIISNDVWGPQAILNPGNNLLSPLAMWNSPRWFTRNHGVGPDISVRDDPNSPNAIPDYGTTNDPYIAIWASDGPLGSNLTRAEIWNGEPITGQIVYVDDANHSENLHIYEPPALLDGQYTVRVFDQAGNYTETHFNINRCGSGPDTTPPLITLDPTALNACVSQPGPFNLTGKVSDNCSDPSLTFQGNAVTGLQPTGVEHEFSFNIPTNLNAGTNPIALEAVDQSTPTANHAPLNFDIRVGPPGPQLVSVAPPDGALDIPPSSIISANFNETLTEGTLVVSGGVSGNSVRNGNTISYPHSGLPQDRTFTARVLGLTNQCGNSLFDPAWTFSTSNIENKMDEPPGGDRSSGNWSNADQVCVGGSIEVPVTGGPTSMQVCAGSLGCQTVLS